MNKKKLVTRVVILALTFCFIGFGTRLIASEQLDDANATFTYKEKPIHPYLVHEFSNWLSEDRPPMVTVVDVAASFDTNKYLQSAVEKLGDGWWETKEAAIYNVAERQESFRYRWLGKMANGTHVLETEFNGGGSGEFEVLMFIKFSEGEIMHDDQTEKQLLMTNVGTYSLGDRYEGKIEVLPDKVRIPASKSHLGVSALDKDVELKFSA